MSKKPLCCMSSEKKRSPGQSARSPLVDFVVREAPKRPPDIDISGVEPFETDFVFDIDPDPEPYFEDLSGYLSPEELSVPDDSIPFNWSSAGNGSPSPPSSPTAALNATFTRSPPAALNATFTRSPPAAGNATFTRSPPAAGNATFARSPPAAGNATFARSPPAAGNATFARSPPAAGNATFARSPPVAGNATFARPQRSGGTPLNFSEQLDRWFPPGLEYSDRGPYNIRRLQIPENLQKLDPYSASMHRTFPTSPVRRPTRNYSTYPEDRQLFDLTPVRDYRRRQPRFFSTPQSPGFRGAPGIDMSSVWGQDNSSFTNSSSEGWSQGVRMDSFNVRRMMTPSPRKVAVPPRKARTMTSPSPRSPDRTAPAYYTPPRARIEGGYTSAELRRTPSPIKSPVAASGTRHGTFIESRTGSGMLDETSSSRPRSAGALFTSTEGESTGGRTSVSGGEVVAYDPNVSASMGNLNTLLEIRAPSNCTSPLQLSINVSCKDKSMIVSPKVCPSPNQKCCQCP